MRKLDSRFCDKCNSIKSYSQNFDAYFCAQCNEWKEPGCNDPGCFFCQQRPSKPLEDECLISTTARTKKKPAKDT